MMLLLLLSEMFHGRSEMHAFTYFVSRMQTRIITPQKMNDFPKQNSSELIDSVLVKALIN